MSAPNPSTKRDASGATRGRDALSVASEGRIAAVHERSVPYGASLTVESYRLENGLRLLLTVDRSAPVVAYQTVFRVGSRYEQDGKTGLAHLLEHLMFVETEGLSEGEFDRRLEQAGVDTNAATWVDWTFYYENAPAGQLGLVIDLEAKRMGKLVLREEKVRSELEVVANERRYRVEDDVDGSVSEELYTMAFRTHGYRIPTIGRMDDIVHMTREDCEAFYRTYYAPNNATIAVVGSFDELQTVEQIASAYGYLKPADIPVEETRPEPPQREERKKVMEKPCATHKLMLGYHAPAFGDSDHVALSVLCDILFGGRASRVHRAMIQEAGIATDVRGWVGTFQHPGVLEMHCVARPGHTSEELLEALDALVSQTVEKPVELDELERSKARAELGLVRGLETCGGKAEQIAFFDTLLGDPAGAFRRLDQLRRVERSDVLRVARRYLRHESRTVILVHPTNAEKEQAS